MKISCIIPAHNEGHNISGVLKIVTACSIIDEVIVVDDGSKDNTSKIASGFPKVKLIIHPKNLGKSAAICSGISEAQGDFLMLIDADLLNLQEQDIVSLATPVIDGRADVSISLRGNTPWFWRIIGIDYISGERVFSREFIFPHIQKILKLPGFGLEVFINSLIIKNHYRIQIVPWSKVCSPYKFKKYSFWKGIRDDIGMIADILRTVSFFGLLSQIIIMRRLRVVKDGKKS